jgi:exosortase E/protease (VPEID-CTERM system)
MIGHAGAREIATRGFHSQAGWIAFNSVAFGLSVVARRLPWFSSREVAEPAAEGYPAAPYLVPFLAILAAGMVSRAATGGFEWSYSLRLLAAGAALWMFRRHYSTIDWSFGWLGPATGVVVFALWIALERGNGAGMPAPLASASSNAQAFWIATRVAAAVLTVPIAEELAFRGFLLRRFISADFELVPFTRFTAFSIAASSVLFGLMHGDRWIAGTVAGALYACASLRKGRLGEAVAAHATTNALLAAYVLAFQRWSLW